MSVAAAALLALVAGAQGTWQLEARGEARGFAGAGGARRAFEVAQYELAPMIRLGVLDDSGSTRFELGYVPRLTSATPSGAFDAPGTPTAFHMLDASLGYRPDERWALGLMAHGAFGIRELSPLASTPGYTEGTPPAVPGTTDPAGGLTFGGVRSASYGSIGGGVSADYQLTPRLRMGASTALSRDGGRGSLAQTVYPKVASTSGELRLVHGGTTQDTVSLRATASRTEFAAASATLLGLALRWDRILSARWSVFLGGGASDVQETSADPATHTAVHVLPFVEAGATLAGAGPGRAATREQAGGWDARVQVLVGPYVDPFLQETLVRATSSLNLSWRSGGAWRITASAGTVTTTSRSRIGPNTVVGAVAFWWHTSREMDSSIHLRGAWQEVVPARTAPWQWGL